MGGPEEGKKKSRRRRRKSWGVGGGERVESWGGGPWAAAEGPRGGRGRERDRDTERVRGAQREPQGVRKEGGQLGGGQRAGPPARGGGSGAGGMPGPRAPRAPPGPGERRPLLERRPRGPRRWRRAAAAAVLLVQMLERAAFFGVAGNLVLYLNSPNLQWDGGQASSAALVFLGASYLLAPVGGWLADVYLGRFRAITLSLLLYLVASSLLPATAFPDGRRSFCGERHQSPLSPACPSHDCARPWHPPYCAPTLYVSLLLLALAASSVRSNLTSFGADQVSGRWARPLRGAGVRMENEGRRPRPRSQEALAPGMTSRKPLPSPGLVSLFERTRGCSLEQQ